MKLFKKNPDGGKNSGVTGYWLIEWKQVFSICLLKFERNHRENFHSHAFNALTWWISGHIVEEFPNETQQIWRPSLMPKFTPKSNIHKIKVDNTAWAFSIRGPWDKTWKEVTPCGKEITLTNGRKVINA